MDGMAFRAVTANTMNTTSMAASAIEFSSTLVATVSGGVLRRTIQAWLGIAICTPTITTFPETPPIRETVFLSVASGINFCDKRGQSQACLSSAERSKKDEIIYLFLGY